MCVSGCGEAVAARLRGEAGEREPMAAHGSTTVRAALVRRRRSSLATSQLRSLLSTARADVAHAVLAVEPDPDRSDVLGLRARSAPSLRPAFRAGRPFVAGSRAECPTVRLLAGPRRRGERASEPVFLRSGRA